MIGRPDAAVPCEQILAGAGFVILSGPMVVAELSATSELAGVDAVLLVAGDDGSSLPHQVRELRIAHPELPVVVAGIAHDAPLVRELWRAGAADLLFADERSSLAAVMTRACSGRSHQLEQALAELEQSYEETLRALTLALDAREQETAGHSHRVALWTLYFSLVARVPEEELLTIHRGALLHDIGKIGIPDPILLKRGELTPEEWTVMRTHPTIGRDLLVQVAHLKAAAAIPWSHHERWDGRGYPRGIAAEEICTGARLFAIVDVYDALRSARPYKVALSHAAAIEIMGRERGAHFDPRLVDLFTALPEETWAELKSPALSTMVYPQLRKLAGAVLARREPAAAKR